MFELNIPLNSSLLLIIAGSLNMYLPRLWWRSANSMEEQEQHRLAKSVEKLKTKGGVNEGSWTTPIILKKLESQIYGSYWQNMINNMIGVIMPIFGLAFFGWGVASLLF